MLIAIMLLAWVVTKAITDGRIDHTYAKQGLVSPRLEAKYGSKQAARDETARYGFVDYAKDAYSDHWQRRAAVLAADREAFVADPSMRVPLRQRWANAKRAMNVAYRKVVDPVPARTAQPADEAAPLVAPATVEPIAHDPGTWTVGADGEQVPLAPIRPGPAVGRATVPTTDGDPLAGIAQVFGGERARRAALSPEEAAAEEAWRTKADAAQVEKERQIARRLGIPYDSNPRTATEMRADYQRLMDEAKDAWNRRDWAAAVAAWDQVQDKYPAAYAKTWIGSTDDPGVPRQDPLYQHHAEGRRRMANEAREASDQVAEPSTTPSTTGGTPMTAPTGEAVNYETTVAELEALAREQRGHLDHCAAALKSINDAKASINDMQESYRASAAAAALTSEHLAAKNLDGVTLANAGTTADAMPAGVVDAMYDQLEAMEEQAKARLADAEVALGATETNLSHIQSEYGDAHAKVAGNLSGDASFLDSAGGAPVGGGNTTGGGHEQRPTSAGGVGARAGAGETVNVAGDAVGGRGGSLGRVPAPSGAAAGGGSSTNVGVVQSGSGRVNVGGNVAGVSNNS